MLSFIKALLKTVGKHPMAAVIVCVLAFGLGGVPAIVASGENGLISPATTQQLSSDSQDEALHEATQAEKATVVANVDGDTIKCRLESGEENYVRLIGIDCPESVAADKSKNCEEGIIASNFTKSLVAPGNTVWLTRDKSDVDRYDRWLRFVWLEEPSASPGEEEIISKMLNAILVSHGYAQAKEYKPDTSLALLFERLGEDALQASRGVSAKWA